MSFLCTANSFLLGPTMSVTISRPREPERDCQLYPIAIAYKWTTHSPKFGHTAGAGVPATVVEDILLRGACNIISNLQPNVSNRTGHRRIRLYSCLQYNRPAEVPFSFSNRCDEIREKIRLYKILCAGNLIRRTLLWNR